MRFGPVAPADAIGGVVVHTIRRGKLMLKKGTVIGADRSRGADLGRRQPGRGRRARQG